MQIEAIETAWTRRHNSMVGRNKTTWTKETAPRNGGRKKLTKEQREARDVGIKQLSAAFSKYHGATEARLKSALQAAKTPICDKVFIKVVLQSRKDGNTASLERYYNRVLGKPKEDIDLYVEGELNTQAAIKKEDLANLMKATGNNGRSKGKVKTST